MVELGELKMSAQDSISVVKSILPELFENQQIGGYLDDFCILIDETNPGEVHVDEGETDGRINDFGLPPDNELWDLLDEPKGHTAEVLEDGTVQMIDVG